MGGIGKSVLAAAFARTPQVRDAFSDGIFWITIGLKPDLAGTMRMIGTKLGDDPAKYSSEVEAEDSLSKVLSDKTCFIILDDVWKVQHAQPFFNSLGASCKLLITTRNDEVITSLGAKKYEIKILSEDQALRLLANWCEQEVDSLPAEAAEVARECGYLPLALSICGALARSGRQWSHILKALKDANLRFIKAQMPDYFYDGVMASLEAGINFLEQDNPDAVLRYRELVIFPPDELIPEAAILTLWMSTGNLKDYEASGLLTELENQALLNIEQKGSERFVSLHDLQHDYLRDTIRTVKAIHKKLIDAYSKKCNGIWTDGPDDNYFFKHLAYHLKEAGMEEELLDLLFDLKWMQAKLSKVLLLWDKPDVSALIHDYAFVSHNTESDLVRDAIKLSAHILAKDKNQLENQLLGRLLDLDSDRIKRLLEKAHESGKKHQKLLLLNSTLKAPGGSLIRTLTGHEEGVRSIAITPDGKYAVSASDDRTLKIWDIEKGEEKATLDRHKYGVNSVAITPDGKYAVSASSDRTLKIWDIEKGEEKATLIGHKDRVESVAITPDGKYAVSASYDSTLKIWDLEKGEEKATLIGHENWVNSVAITCDDKYAVSASDDHTLKIWNLKKGEEQATLIGHEDWVNSVAITRDGKYAVSASDDHTLKIWDLMEKKLQYTFIGECSFYTCAFSPTCDYIVAGDSLGNVYFFSFFP
jgi:WD40 repeat protein